MRLLNARTKKLEQFFGDNIPEYAILSHTWGPEELTYGEYMASGCLPSNFKIDGCCSIALGQQLEYVWIDTICIDKSSSAELSEAINSMYEWYRKAMVCFAYLSDVSCNASTPIADIASSDSDFSRSRWFTRGWTLQELIAPRAVSFFNNQWELIGHKQQAVSHPSYRARRARRADEVSILTILRRITNIPLVVLDCQTPPASISVATRMTWAAKRQTTRREDMAYCLLGLFNINMTMLYGEGDRAFRRLQEEIIRTSDDESIFVWGFGCTTADALTRGNKLYIEADTLLASSPADFERDGRRVRHIAIPNPRILANCEREAQ
ncbi:HET-domain-containing protein [Cladorrhinum sp. PSN259]|nr:HET-domain-containing protein [Cladorrhinum sp. PSN259]